MAYSQYSNIQFSISTVTFMASVYHILRFRIPIPNQLLRVNDVSRIQVRVRVSLRTRESTANALTSRSHLRLLPVP
jgi:hypothetical protein